MEARQLAESVIAVNYRPLHDLGVSQEEAGLWWWRGQTEHQHPHQIKGGKSSLACEDDNDRRAGPSPALQLVFKSSARFRLVIKPGQPTLFLLYLLQLTHLKAN